MRQYARLINFELFSTAGSDEPLGGFAPASQQCAIVTDITVVPQATTTMAWSITVNGGSNLMTQAVTSTDKQTWYQWTGNLVLYPGESLYGRTDDLSHTIDVVVNGFFLPSPIPIEPASD